MAIKDETLSFDYTKAFRRKYFSYKNSFDQLCRYEYNIDKCVFTFIMYINIMYATQYKTELKRQNKRKPSYNTC